MNINDRINELVIGTKGMKASFLCAQLSTEYIFMESREIKIKIIEMIISGQLVEIEYMLPNENRNESLLLPKGSKVIEWSNK